MHNIYFSYKKKKLCLFVRTLHATRPIRSFSAGNDIYDRCRYNLQNKMAAPEASVHQLKIVFVTIWPSERKLFTEMLEKVSVA